MRDAVKAASRKATRQLLRTFCKFLLDARIGVGEFVAVAKQEYVRTAAEQGRDRGEATRPNVSRISNVTGLTRLDVTEILKALQGQSPEPTQRGKVRAERVLSGWWTDPEFQDATTGRPATLKIKGGGQSFAALVRKYSGDSTNSAPILNELLDSGAVIQNDDGTLDAVRSTCARVDLEHEDISAMGDALRELVETSLYNLKNPQHPRFAQRVVCPALDAEAAKVVIPGLTEDAQIFVEGAQELLLHPKNLARSKRARDKAIRFSVAIQFFEEPAAKKNNTQQRARPTREPTRRGSRARKGRSPNGGGAA